MLVGAQYIAEIDALGKVTEICNAYGWEKHCKNNEIVSALSLLGTDFGKPNQTPLGDHLAKGNRAMFAQIEAIVKKRIGVLEKEFKQLPKKNF